mmetsp:Transcript_12440/g.20637  ORF Transcript_12440/g.20637 Transcript_12440/m.20637 type:complete len:123 (-) Transcript_12440:1568-1936(-)
MSNHNSVPLEQHTEELHGKQHCSWERNGLAENGKLEKESTLWLQEEWMGLKKRPDEVLKMSSHATPMQVQLWLNRRNETATVFPLNDAADMANAQLDTLRAMLFMKRIPRCCHGTGGGEVCF